MRRLAFLTILVVALGCTDNTHPPPLPNELPNQGGLVSVPGVGQGPATTSTGTGGFGGFGSTSTGALMGNDCECVAAEVSNLACANCWDTANAMSCLTQATDCFDNSATCGSVKQCTVACAGDHLCEKTCFLNNPSMDTFTFQSYLMCVCTVCAASCTYPTALDCSIPPTTASSTSTGVGGFGP